MTGKGIRDAGSKALDVCKAIGAQRMVRAIMEQMARLPPGPGRVNLLYLIDACLKQQNQQRASGQQLHAQIAELPGRVAAALLSLTTSAVYDLESLRKVRQLLDLWVKQGRVTADCAKPVHQQMAVFERQASAQARLARLGIVPGLPVQYVILTAHDQLLDPADKAFKLLRDESAQQQQPAPATLTAAAGAVVGADGIKGDVATAVAASPAAAVKVEPPASPSEEGLLAALVADADWEEGEVMQQPQQQQQRPQQQQQQPKWPLYENLFGPATVSGYVLQQYKPLDHFCQLPLVTTIAQHLGKQAAASAAAAAAAKQNSCSSRQSGLLAVLQQRGLELRWAPEVLSARDEDWLLQDHEAVKHKAGTWRELLEPLDKATDIVAMAAAAAAAAANAAAAGAQQQEAAAAGDAAAAAAACAPGGGGGEFAGLEDGDDEEDGQWSCPAAPQRDEAAGFGSVRDAQGFGYNNNQGFGGGWYGGFGMAGGQMGMTAAAMNGSAADMQAAMVAAAKQTAISIGMAGNAAAVSVGAAAAAVAGAFGGQQQQQQQPKPAWLDQLDELQQEQEQAEAEVWQQPQQLAPPLPPEDETVTAAGGPQQQQQQQGQAKPRAFVVPGAPDDDDEEEDDDMDLGGGFGAGGAAAGYRASSDDGYDPDAVPPLPPPLPPPDASPVNPPLPPDMPPPLPPYEQETSPLYDPTLDDDDLPPPLPSEPPPLPQQQAVDMSGGHMGMMGAGGYGGYGAAGMQMGWGQHQQMAGGMMGYGANMAMQGAAAGMQQMGAAGSAAGMMAMGAMGGSQQQQYMQQQMMMQHMQQQQIMMQQQQMMGAARGASMAPGMFPGGQQGMWAQQQPGMQQQGGMMPQMGGYQQ